MNKTEFLSELRKGLSGLPKEDIDERVEFYSEMLDDKIEEGIPEEDAVASLGSLDGIIAQIISEIPLSKLVKKKIKPKRKLSTTEIVLLAVGSPIWGSLLIALLAVVFSIYASLWAVVIAFWSIVPALLGTALGGTVLGAINLFKGNVPVFLAMIGISLVSLGLSVFAFYGCMALTRGTVLLTKKIVFGIKLLFMRKDRTE